MSRVTEFPGNASGSIDGGSIDDAREAALGPPPQASDLMQRVMWVLWPAFLVAGIAEGIVFTVIDPHDVHLWDDTVELSRTAIYTLGFFFFWAITTASSALTVFLAKSPWEVNRCPLPATARPDGCPKREDCADC